MKLVIKNQTGMSLISTVVAIGCMAVLVSTTIDFILGTRKITTILFNVNVRDKLQSTIKTVARLPTSYKISQDRIGNEALSDCLFVLHVFDPDDKGDCINGQLHDFMLFGPIFYSSGGITFSSGQLAGSSTAPVHYDEFGAAAGTTSGAIKAFSAKATFRAQCPSKILGGPPEPVCDVAELIEVTYDLESNLPQIAQSGTKLAPMRETIILSVKSISGEDSKVDPTLLPPPPPTPPAPPTPPSSPPTTPVPPIKKPPKIKCIGNTIQTGPYQCSCPPGEILKYKKKGICEKISQ